MALSPEMKTSLQEAGEETLKVALEQTLKVAEAYAASTESTVDDTVVAGVRMVYDAFLKDLVEKVNPND